MSGAGPVVLRRGMKNALAEPVASISLAEAKRFLDLMAEGEAVTFQTFADSGNRKSSQLATILHGDLDQHAARLQALNERGAGIFWMANYGDGKGRTAANVTGIRCVFLDLDGAPVEPVLSAGAEPHAVVESSPGRWHVYWLVTGCALEQFGCAQKALARNFGGDASVHDLCRVMRMPGFIHRKGDPFTSRIRSLEPTQPYAFNDLVRRLGLQLKPRRVVARVDLDTGEISSKVKQGGRHAHLVRWAAQLNWRGMSGKVIRAAVQEENLRTCVPPQGDAEVAGIVRDILKRYADQHGRDPSNNVRRVEFLPQTDAGLLEWQAPLLPGAASVPEISADLLGGWMGAMASAVAASTQTPPAMAALSTLTVLAAVLQRRFEVAPWGDDYREPLALWTMTVLGSGSRKTAVHKALTQVLVNWEKQENDRLRRELARVAAQRDVIGKRIENLKLAAGKEADTKLRLQLQEQIAALREEMPGEMFAPRLFCSDVTSETLQRLLVEQDERIAVLSDEGGIFTIMAGAYSGGRSSIDVFLQSHAGAAMRVDRADRMAHLDKPAVSFGLALQPGILQDTGKARRFRDSGLMARFLYAVPRSTVGLRDVRQRIEVGDDVRREYEARVNHLLDGMRRPIGAPRVLPFSTVARNAWLELAEEIERGQGEGGRYAHMADWTSKLPGAAARIAGLLALGEHGTKIDEIPLAPVERAVALARLLIPHAEAAFALMGAADGESDAHALLAFIKRHKSGTVVRRELQKAMEGRFRSLDRMMVAIKLLQDWHVLGPERKTSGAGRPSIFYQVNPKLFVD